MRGLLDLPSARWLLALAAALVELTAPVSILASEGQKQVLVLYSTRRDAQIVTVVDRELPRILAEGLGAPVDQFSEYIDQGRFPDPAYRAAFRDFLRLKYRGQQFDVVVAIKDAAIAFLAENRDELFPGTPLVFSSGSPAAPRPDNSTGIIAEPRLAGTLELAAALQPNVRRVYVVSGAAARDKAYETLARAQLKRFESSFTFTYLSGLKAHDLENRLAALPPNSIVYFLLVYRDSAGENFQPLEYLARVTALANAPVYCWVDSAMGLGVVGGNLLNQKAEAESIARLALRVLKGEPVSSIPLSSPDLHVSQVDWRELRRWGISEARVPNGTLVRFREPSAWDRYRGYMLSGALLLVAQTALIAALLVQRARRRHAEERMRGSDAQVLTTLDRVRDLGGRLLNAQEAERSRIARELHDDIGQQLTVLTIDLELLANGDREEPGRLIEDALHRAHDISASLHDLSHRLHPAKLRLLGLISSLQALQRELAPSDISVVFTHDSIPSKLPPDLTLCLFRVVQEALQNAVKYSHADEISVHLGRGVQGLKLTIVDDGVGFDVQRSWGKGLGLISMRERLDAIGGTLEIQSEPGVGTRLEISVELPVLADAEEAAAV